MFELNKSYPIDIPGAGVYNLTRIVPDEDPTGFTKWGVQDSDDPNYVNWCIRVNRYAKSYTGVKLEILFQKDKFLQVKLLVTTLLSGTKLKLVQD